MFTNSNLDNLDRYVASVTKTGEYRGNVESTNEITVQQYVNEFAGLMYRRMRKAKGFRISTTYKYEFGCEVIICVSEPTGYKTRYVFNPKEG